MEPTPTRAVLLLGLLALTAGCRTPSSAPPTLPLATPEAWTAAGGHPAEVSAEETDRWWERFGDPTLDRLVDEALRRNSTLAAAAARLDQAIAQAVVAGADRLPQAGAGLSGSRRRQNFIGLPIPGAEGEVLTNTTTTLGLTLDVAWEVDLWGRLRAGRGAGLARSEAAEADLAAVRLSLIGQLAKARFASLEARAQLQLAEETLTNRHATRKQIESRYRQGLRSALDLRLALASEADAEAQVSSRAQAADLARRRLEILLGRYPEGRYSEGGANADGDLLPDGPPVIAVGQPAELVTRRPDLIAAEARLVASGLDVAAAKAALYPQLRLSGAIGRSSTELGDLFDQDFSVWSLAAGLVQPIFQGGRLRAAVDASEARRLEAAHDYLAAALGAFLEVESALAAEGFVQTRLTALGRAADQALAARSLAMDRYRSGLADYLTVLESQRQATLAQSQLLATRRQLLDSRIDLHLALGGDYAPGDPTASPTGTNPRDMP